MSVPQFILVMHMPHFGYKDLLSNGITGNFLVLLTLRTLSSFIFISLRYFNSSVNVLSFVVFPEQKRKNWIFLPIFSGSVSFNVLSLFFASCICIVCKRRTQANEGDEERKKNPINIQRRKPLDFLSSVHALVR